MFPKMNVYKDGTYYMDANEGSASNFHFNCLITPEHYNKLLKIAHKNGILTFDISTVINYVIETYPQN